MIMNKMPSLYATLLLVFPGFWGFDLHAQIVIDPALPGRYELSKRLFPPDFQEFFRKTDALDNGDQLTRLALITYEQTDTLNKQELVFPDYSGIEIITDIPEDSMDIKAEKELEACRCGFMFSGANLSGDTLSIFVGDMMGPLTITHTVIGDRVSTSYSLYARDIDDVRLNEEDPLGDQVTVPVEVIKFELSSMDFSPGNLIYGYCVLDTAPYYQRTDTGDSVMNIRKRLKYYFSFVVRSEE